MKTCGRDAAKVKQGKLLILGHKVNSCGQLRPLRGVFAGLLAGLLLGLSGIGWADSYRWTDDDGQTVYSQSPPADGRPYRKIGAPPPPPDADGARKQLDAMRQGQDERRQQQQQSEEEQRQAAEQQAAMEKNCDVARRNVSLLEGAPRRPVRMPDGSVKRLTTEERQALLDEARQYLQDYCR
jgi:hypothetical protein